MSLRLSLRHFTILVGLFALTLGGEAPRSQARVTVSPRVAERAAAGETVRVIIGVDTSFVLEGQLASAADVASQRAQMRASVSTVMSRAALAGAVTEAPFDFIPFFPARVTHDSLEKLRLTPGVVSVEEVITSTPSTYVSVPLTNTPAAITAGFNGSGWAVAVLDSGSDTTHSMLAGSALSEACYSSSGTSLCPGGAAESTAPGSGQNCNWAIDGCDHGTHVASIAVGSAGTSFGPGMAPGAWLIPIQVFHMTPQGLSASSVDWTRGLTRVLALAGANNANRIAAVNMSLGSGRFANYCDSQSPAAKAAIDNLRSIGVATIVASGNDGFTNSIGFPACLSSAISVGNTTKFSPIAVNTSSNEAPFLSLLAPGTDIDAASSFGLYAFKTGTSMAAPHVAGAWAILKQAVPTASVTSVLAALRGTGTPITDTRTGRRYPLINVNAARIALASGAFSTPGAPANVRASVSGNALTMSWTAGAGGAPTSYTLVARGGIGGPILGTLALGNVTSFASPAPNGVFALSLTASNAVGTGPESAGVTVTVPAVAPPPGAPSGLTATVAGNAATLAWAAPSSGGAVANYALIVGLTPAFAVPIGTLPLPAGSTTTTVAGIPAGTYYVRVMAQNAGGSSAASNEVTVAVAGPAAPGAPTFHAPTVSGRTVGLSWTPGGGGAATSYVLTALTSGGVVLGTVPLSGTSVSVPNVASGSYLLRLVAVNGVGASPVSNTVTLVVP